MTTPTAIRTSLFLKYPQLGLYYHTTAQLAQANLLIADAQIDILNYASATTWGNSYTRAIELLSAHYLQIAKPENTNSGIVTKEDRDGVITEYMRPTMSNYSELSTTKYGMMFEALKKSLGINSDNLRTITGFIV
jgi:hypothetical protein